MAAAARRGASAWFLTLFGLPFLAFGCLASYWAVRDVALWARAQAWVETPCRLLAAELETHVDSDDGETYEATAHYRYVWQEQVYESRRVGIGEGADNVGSYQKRAARQLEDILRAGGQTICFVNPQHPAEALLLRELRTGLVFFKGVFALVFLTVGIGIPWAGRTAARRTAAEAAVAAEHPDEPWRVRADWASGVIRSDRRGSLFAVGFVALLWNAIAWAAMGAAWWSDPPPPPWLLIAVGSFPLVGLCLAGWVVVLTLRALKWSPSTLELASVPGVIGGRMAGVIHAPLQPGAAPEIELTLTCLRRRVEGAGKQRSEYHEPLWQARKSVVRTLGDAPEGGTAIPVGFSTPYDAHPTDSAQGVRWVLEARAAMSGLDYCEQFEVPVFRTPLSSPHVSGDELMAAYEAPIDLGHVVRRCGGVLQSVLPDEWHALFPAGRNRGAAITILGIAVVWSMISGGLWFSDAPRVFPIVFSLFALPLWAGALWAWLEQSELHVSGREIAFRQGLLGLGSLRRYAPDAICDVAVEPSGTRVNGVVYQQVAVVLEDGRRVRVLSGIAALADAKQLADEIRRTLGLDRTVSRESEMPTSLADSVATF